MCPSFVMWHCTDQLISCDFSFLSCETRLNWFVLAIPCEILWVLHKKEQDNPFVFSNADRFSSIVFLVSSKNLGTRCGTFKGYSRWILTPLPERMIHFSEMLDDYQSSLAFKEGVRVCFYTAECLLNAIFEWEMAGYKADLNFMK